jgi:PKD repeat protein
MLLEKTPNLKTPRPMVTRLPLLSGCLALIAGTAFGQLPYAVVVNGELAACTPGATVTVQTGPGTLPAQTVSVPVDSACSFTATLLLNSASGDVFAFTSCANGTITGDSAAYDFGSAATGLQTVTLALACGNDTADACQACISVVQLQPFTALFTSCSSGGTPPYSCGWLMPNGTIVLGDNPSFTFTQPGIYGICMQVSDATGCSSVACDTVFVAADGTVSTTNTAACQAGFWTVQAYEDTSNGGGLVAPIPNEVWAVNLSTPNDENVQFAWDFGDGGSSAEAYPSHTYSGPGPWLLCLTITSGNCTSSFCDTVSVDANGYLNGMIVQGHGADANIRDGGFTLNVIQSVPTGIPELPAFGNFRLWPNPVEDELNLSFSGMRGGMMALAVIDHTGRVVLQRNRPIAVGTNTLQIATGNLAPGLYLLHIGTGKSLATHRFVKLQ